MGRLDVARAAGISNSRVCDLVQDMLDEGLVIEDNPGQDRRGRRGVPLRINPRYGTLLGFDLEALRLRMVACDFAGGLLDERQEKLGPVDSRQELLERLQSFIEGSIAEMKPNRKLRGIGLATAGVTDTQRGIVLHYDMLDVARDLPLRDLVASQTGLPCWMESNINALAIAEWMDGAARGLENFICFAVRSGVGAGIVLNGRLHTGHRGLAGEAGYVVVPGGSSPSQWKYLQQLVSERALGIDTEGSSPQLSTARADRAGELLGSQLASMVALLDVQAVVLAGQLVQPEGELYEPLLRSFRRFVLPELADSTHLLPAQLGPYAAAIGAAHGCFQGLHPTAETQQEPLV
jgi:predicted NBD/HSP70 family sugar kinase